MGPHHRTDARLSTHELQDLRPDFGGTEGTGLFPGRKSEDGEDQTIDLADGFTVLLRQKEGWKSTTCPGLPTAQLQNNQKQIPATSHSGVDRQDPTRQILH